MSLAAATSTEGKGGHPARPAAGSFLPGMTEMQMSKLTYREQLLHPNWQRKRLEILTRDGFRCLACGDSETTLHVHHKRYVKGRMVWEYEGDDLATLCDPCHASEHQQLDAFRELTARLPVDGPGSLHNAKGLIAGWAHGQQGVDTWLLFGEEPFHYLLGEIAKLVGIACTMDELIALHAAMSSRDPYTVSDALNEMALKLPDRPASASPQRGSL